MKRTLVVLAALTLVAGVAWSATAATAGGRTQLKCMDSRWRTTKVSTSSTTFVSVPGLRDSPDAIFPIAINVSALVSGAPVQFRMLSTNVGGQTHASRPGPTRFVPVAGGANSFAYQWVESNQAAAVHSNSLLLQWRSPSGRPVHLLRGDMTVAYTTTTCQGSS